MPRFRLGGWQTPAGCPPSVQHQGRTYNFVGSIGGELDGSYVSPAQYINVTNNKTFTGTVGNTYGFTWRAQVYCTIAGIFWSDSGSQNIQIVPTISGPNTVWFFNYLTVDGYATSIQLTSSGGASTTWSVTSGADKVNVSSYTGPTTTVTSSGTAFSSGVGDVKSTATVNGVSSTPFPLTTRTPNLAIPGTITNACDGQWGYLTTLNYTIKDQFPALLPSGVPVNEDFTTDVFYDYTGTNWRQSTPNGKDYPGSYFADGIGGENLLLPPYPVPTCDGNSTAIEHWNQEFRVGSVASGFGRRIQTDTLQKYLGHAAHTGITSPAP